MFSESNFLGVFFGVRFGVLLLLSEVRGDLGECRLRPGVPLEFLRAALPGVGGPGFWYTVPCFAC